jgi:hypothetical protein
LGSEEDERRDWLGKLIGDIGKLCRVEAVHVAADVAAEITRYARVHPIN